MADLTPQREKTLDELNRFDCSDISYVKPEKTSESGYVYIIKQELNDANWKLGMAKFDVKRRMKALQTGNPDKLCIYCSVYVSNVKNMERAMHYFSPYSRTVGEWFLFPKKTIDGLILQIHEEAHKEKPILTRKKLRECQI